MDIKKIITVSAGTLMFVTNITPVAATTISSVDSVTVGQICEDSIDESAKLIQSTVDSISIEKDNNVQEQPFDPVSNVSGISYTYEEMPVEQIMTVDEFMSLYENMMQETPKEPIVEVVSVPVDTAMEQAAYDIALSNYNSALAEYEAANQMIETSKEVEVEITEEVMDEEGNVSQVTRTEIQTITEMAPAGDVVSAQANLDTAQIALDSAQQALDAKRSSTETVVSQVQENEIQEIDESVISDKPVTYSSSGTCGDNLTWTLNDNGALSISGTGDMKDYTASGWPIKINSPWADNADSIKTVVINEGVTSVGSSAFSHCPNLTSVTLPKTITSIGSAAFSSDTNLSNINIPNTVTSIASDAFYETAFINNYPDQFVVLGDGILYKYTGTDTEITIPDSVKIIDDFVFNNKTNLVNVTLPAKLESIGHEAFRGCTNLKSIVIPNSVTTMGRFVFQGCSSLSDVTLSNALTTIEQYAFADCTNLKNISIPKNVVSIGGHAFSGCSSITNLIIPDSVTKIGDYAFSDCSELIDLNLSKNLTSIGQDVFEGTAYIKYFTGDFIILNNNILYKYNGQGTDLSIPNTIKSIAGRSLPGTLTSVHIPDSVVDIGNYAFASCIALKEIIIPASVKNIGMYAFNYCIGLTEMTIPEGIKEISHGLFSDCFNLEKVVIPNTVTKIDHYAFWNCGKLSDITIPDGVTEIGEAAFVGCGITSITIPKSVTHIWQWSFDISGDTLKDIYYEGTEKEWNEKNLYDFGDKVTVHFLGIPFTDVPKDAWYYSVAKECYETGLINGTSATTFSPMQTMTRAMVVTILWRMDGQPKTDFNNKFKDVSSKQWYATSISWAVNNGVVNGYGDGTFKPDAAVTREQVAVMLANYAGYKKVYKPGTKKLNTYPDGSQVSAWAQQGMKWALTNGIISGDGAGYLRPKKSATRAEGAAMLLRMNNWL